MQSEALFNRDLLTVRRNRAAKRNAEPHFLAQMAAMRIADSLNMMSRQFPAALNVGAGRGEVAQALATSHLQTGIAHLTLCDAAADMLATLTHAPAQTLPFESTHVLADEETLPFATESFDFVTSALSLHHVNALPKTLTKIRQVLKPDGLFLGVLFGPHTLRELRAVLEEAEIHLHGGVSPHVSPFPEIRDAGSLLGHAGFALPVIDSETLTISYPSLKALLADIRHLGETNILHTRRKGLFTPAFLALAEALYQQKYADEEGRLTATVELLCLTAWAPHESQQKPACRGSASMSLQEALK